MRSRLVPIIVLLLAIAPLHADPVAPRPTFGIGAIPWITDGTENAFDAFSYLLKAPPRMRGAAARVFLVDFATDAEWYLSGRMTGEMHETRVPYGRELTCEPMGTFVLRRKGKKVAEIVVGPISLSRYIDQNVLRVPRAELFAPFWKDVSRQVQAKIDATLAAEKAGGS